MDKQKNQLRDFIFLFFFFSLFLLVSGCGKKQNIEKGLQAENIYQVKQLKEIANFTVYFGDSDGESVYLFGVSQKEESHKHGTEMEIIKVTRDGNTDSKIVLNDIDSRMILDDTNSRIVLDGTNSSKEMFFKRIEHGYLLLQREEENYQLLKFWEDGTLENSVLLSVGETIELKEMDLKLVQFSEDGVVYALDYNGNFCVFQKDGRLEKIVKTGTRNAFDQILLKDGSLYCISNSSREFKIYEYTIESLQKIKNGGTAKAVLHTIGLSSNHHYGFIPSSQQDFYIYSNIGIYRYLPKSEETKLPESEEIELICKWTDSGVNGMDILQIFPISKKRFFVLQGERFSTVSNPQQQILYLYPEAETAKQEKQILTLAVLQQWVEIDEMVAEYNRQNEDSRIVVKEYLEMEDPIQAMHDDIVSGNPPDIIDMTPLNVNNYSKKGLLIDLTELMENDSEISKETFVDSIIKALTIDGNLYFLPSWFGVKVLAGNRDTIQGRTSWTFKEFKQLYSKKGKNTLLFGNKTRQNLLNEFLDSMLDGFIDWEHRTADFKNKEFGVLLSFLKDFSESFDTGKKMFKKLQEGKILFQGVHLGNLEMEYCFYNEIFHNMELIGYPSMHGSGISAESNAPMIAITSSCKEKEKAFQFLKMFWTYDYQKKWTTISFPFPTRKDALKKKLEYASASKSYIDEDGQEISAVSGTTSFNGIEVNRKPLKKQDRKMILNLIDCLEWFDYNSSERKDIIAIIEEEVKAYFEEDKTVEEVQDIIQSRVNLYINEKK